MRLNHPSSKGFPAADPICDPVAGEVCFCGQNSDLKMQNALLQSCINIKKTWELKKYCPNFAKMLDNNMQNEYNRYTLFAIP